MHHFYLWLFSIPLISMVVIGLYQNLDEISKNKFVLERRKARQSRDVSAGVPRRRYSDSVATASVRQSETGKSEAMQKALAAPSQGA